MMDDSAKKINFSMTTLISNHPNNERTMQVKGTRQIIAANIIKVLRLSRSDFSFQSVIFCASEIFGYRQFWFKAVPSKY